MPPACSPALAPLEMRQGDWLTPRRNAEVARRGIESLSRAGPVQAFRPRDPGNRLVCGFGLNGTNNGIPVAVHLSCNLELH
jgi:hypothetical protein